MSSLQYLGPTTNSDHVLNRLRQNQIITPKVQPSQLQAKLDTASSGLALKTSVDFADSGRPSLSYVNNQDALLLPKTQLGADSGVATLGTGSAIPTEQLERTPIYSIKGPYGWTVQNDYYTEAYYDSTGQWDKWIASIQIPAPGSGFGIWRPLVFGQAEMIISSGNGRAEVFATYGAGGTILARGRGPNGTNNNAGANGMTLLPYKVEDDSVPGGWGDDVSIEVRIFMRASYINSRVAMGGYNYFMAFAQKC